MKTLSGISGAGTDRGELETLLVEYEALLTDERSWTTTLATLTSVGIGLIALIAAGTFGSDSIPICKQPTATCDAFRAISPLAPFVVFLYLEIGGLIATIRSYQLRLVEQRIRERINQADTELVPPIASSATLILGLTSFTRGWPRFRVLIVAAVIGIIGTFATLIGWSVWQIDNHVVRLTSLVVYGAMAAFMASVAATGMGHGRRLWSETLERASNRYNEPLLGGSHPPTPIAQVARAVGYLLVPRPLDLVKGLNTIGVTLLVTTASANRLDLSTVLSHLGLAVAAAGCFELLVYQGRYQLNDIRGLASDLEHHKREVRRRLTVVVDVVGVSRAVGYSLIIVILRFMTFVVAVILVFPREHVALVGCAIAAIALAIPYEALRDAASVEEGEPPNRRNDGSVHAHRDQPTNPRVVDRAIYAFVGSGYAVRGVLGVLLAQEAASTGATVIVALTLGFFGSMFVTMTWALEGTSYLRPSSWTDPIFTRALNAKLHIRPLTTSALSRSQQNAAANASRIALLLRSDDRFVSLAWNQFLLAATLLASASAFVLLRPRPSFGAGLFAAGAAVACAWLLMSVRSLPKMLAALTVYVGVTIVVLRFLGDWKSDLVLTLTPLFILATYIQFRRSTYDGLFAVYDSLGRLRRALAATGRIALFKLAAAVFGPSTLKMLKESEDASES